MIDVELWRAKVSIIAGFASSPAMMIDDPDERDARVASLLVLCEIEYEETESVASLATSKVASSVATISDIHGGEIHASNSLINWPDLIDFVKKHPSKPVTLKYDKHHTAVVTAGRTNKKYQGITALAERRGDAGVVILSCD